MEGLELQTAIVKLDPGVTVATIGTSNLKIIPQQNRISLNVVNVDGNNVTLQNKTSSATSKLNNNHHAADSKDQSSTTATKAKSSSMKSASSVSTLKASTTSINSSTSNSHQNNQANNPGIKCSEHNR